MVKLIKVIKDIKDVHNSFHFSPKGKMAFKTPIMPRELELPTSRCDQHVSDRIVYCTWDDRTFHIFAEFNFYNESWEIWSFETSICSIEYLFDSMFETS